MTSLECSLIGVGGWLAKKKSRLFLLTRGSQCLGYHDGSTLSAVCRELCVLTASFLRMKLLEDLIKVLLLLIPDL